MDRRCVSMNVVVTVYAWSMAVRIQAVTIGGRVEGHVKH